MGSGASSAPLQVSSPHSNGENPVEVLLPTTYDPAKKYRVVYVLPVEPGEERKFGDGMKTMAEIGLTIGMT